MANECGVTPRFSRGEMVAYVDNHGREQEGKVQSIDAHWPGYSAAGSEPYLLYFVEHPTYRGRRYVARESDIIERRP